jgi:hypothetical protein
MKWKHEADRALALCFGIRLSDVPFLRELFLCSLTLLGTSCYLLQSFDVAFSFIMLKSAVLKLICLMGSSEMMGEAKHVIKRGNTREGKRDKIILSYTHTHTRGPVTGRQSERMSEGNELQPLQKPKGNSSLRKQ